MNHPFFDIGPLGYGLDYVCYDRTIEIAVVVVGQKSEILRGESDKKHHCKETFNLI